MNRDTFDDPEKKKQEEQDIPMRRMAQPEEIAKVALFLASSDAAISQVQQCM
jgi:glucose 1-dehydrogenase